jgi:LysM repeat protein
MSQQSARSHVKRSIVWSPLLVGAAVLLGACGEDGTATTSSVAGMGPTNYHTLPTVLATSSTSTLPGGQPAGTITTDVTEYTVQAGDVPFTVAQDFNISLDALNLANAETSGYSAFYVGLVIKIPAGATIPGSVTTTTLPGTPVETTTTLAGGGDNCAPGSYVIVEGDIPSRVAEKFDVTLAQLDAANVNTQGYQNFIVGITIVIPAKSDC